MEMSAIHIVEVLSRGIIGHHDQSGLYREQGAARKQGNNPRTQVIQSLGHRVIGPI